MNSLYLSTYGISYLLTYSIHEINAAIHKARDFRSSNFDKLDKPVMMGSKDTENPTLEIDAYLENLLLQRFAFLNVPVKVVTEEQGIVFLNGGSDATFEFILLLDPLDGTEIFTRFGQGSISLAILDNNGEIALSVVGDISTGIIYYASVTSDGAYFKHPVLGRRQMYPAKAVPWEDAWVISYVTKAERVTKFGQSPVIINPPKRLFTHEGGSIGLVHVANGAVHAMMEFAKGFAPHDLLAGYFIAEKAGVIITHLDGTAIITDPEMVRQKFIAACDSCLLAEMQILLFNEYSSFGDHNEYTARLPNSRRSALVSQLTYS